MKNLKEQKYIALMAIVVLFMAIIALVSFGQIDKYAGKVKINGASIANISTKFNANINELTEDNAIESNGYDVIEYTVNYKIASEEALTRDVVIKATLPADEKYSSFKAVNSNNITSTLSSNKKEIELHISNVPTNTTQETKVKMIIEGAPNGYKVTPSIQIKEETEINYTSVTVKEVEVKTNSLTGTVKDEKGLPVSGIELVLKKNNTEVKSTYTDENGKYIFTDVTEGTYKVEVDEEVYEKVSESNVAIKDSSSLNITVKSVTPYEIHTDKFITSVTIVNNGKSATYTYGEIRKVQQAVKNLKEMTGEVNYVIKVSNKGKKEGMVTVVKDELPEGFSFDSKKNSSWEEKDGILYNRSLEGITLKGGETREEKLTLDIIKTNEAKTYINKVTAKGEIYEKVVFLLDGQTYKTEDVLEGEKIDEELINDENFSGWYIDSNYTNKYNFNNPVRKDLILYGKTEVPVTKYTVTFKDKNPETGAIEPWDEQEVIEGNLATEPAEPTKTGYNFKSWEDENHNEWSFDTPVTKSIVLTSTYEKKTYNVRFHDYSDEVVKTVPVLYKETIDTNEVPVLPEVGHTFIGWYELTQVMSFDFTTQITRDVDLYPHHSINQNQVIFDDENRITTVPVDYGNTVSPIDDQGKVGYTFSHWSLEKNSEEPFNFSTQIIEPTRLYAVYHINHYNVTFIDRNPATAEEVQYGEVQDVTYGGKITKPETDPNKEGYTFNNWQDATGYVWNFADDTVSKNITLYSTYNINKFTVTYIDEGNPFATQNNIPYNTTTTAPTPSPTKEHKIFAGWSLDIDATPIEDFKFATTPITQDITLYSHYVDILPPDISHTPTEWTRFPVTVTIEKEDHPEYSFVYKIDTGEYQNYDGTFTVSDNCTIIAKSVVGTQESVTTSHPITNIDRIKPTIKSISDTSLSPTSIKVDVTAQDNESGLHYIRLYKDDVLADTLVFTENVNNELTGSYTFDDLEQNTSYEIKAIAVDYAGNESEVFTKNITTEYRIVARIIGRENSLYESETQYENFPSLENAIKACPTGQCTIQMVLSTNESVEVLEGQDITLDLNGKNVIGVKDGYTIKNGGDFTLVDWDGSGSVKNANGIALYNKIDAILTLGELEEPLDVSLTAPYVEGGTVGVYSEKIDKNTKGIFNYYDGKIVGTVAIDGEVSDKPYLYNADVKVPEGETKQVSVLKQLAEAEARLNGVYYTQIQKAVDDSSKGTTLEQTTNTNLLQGFKKVASADAGFIYDDEAKTLSSGNNTQGSIAAAYTIIDLTEATEDKELDVTGTYIRGSSLSNTATIEVREESETGTQINYLTPYTYYPTSTFSTTPETVSYILEKGKKYYVKLKNTIQGVNDSDIESTAVMTITDMTIKNYIPTSININAETDVKSTTFTQYGFDYDSNTRTLKSNNQYVPNSIAFSYMEIDLTNEEEDKELIVNATLDTMYYSNYAEVNVKETNTMEYSYSSSSLGYMYAQGPNYSSYPSHWAGTRNFTKVLTHGKKYYLQFYYFKSSDSYTRDDYENYGSSDQFIINTVDLVSVRKEDTTNYLTNLVTPDTYGWPAVEGTSTAYNNNSSYASSTSDPMYNSTAHSYIKVDMTEETEEKSMKIQMYASYTNFYIVVNNSAEEPSSSDPGKVVDANNCTINNYNNYVYAPLTPGEVNYIHFVYKRVNQTYGYSVSLYSANLVDGHYYNLNSELKTLQKGFTEKYSSDGSQYIGTYKQGTTYDSYVKVDLTNATKDEVIDINAKLGSGQGLRYIYVTKDEKNADYNAIENNRLNTLLSYNSYSESTYLINNNYVYSNYTDYKFVLPKGNVYYVHYAFYGRNSYSEDVYLKSISRYPITSDINIGKVAIAKGVESSSITGYVESDGTTDDNFRYVGSTPNNYVTFNDETWRIIGVFNVKGENGKKEKRIKLMRESGLNTGGLSLSYDTTPLADPSTNSINGGNGINEWSQADLMKLLNPGYNDNEEEIFTYDSASDTYSSEGTKKVNNSLYWNKASGNCFKDRYNQAATCDFTSTGLDSTSKSMIDTVEWNLGAISYDNINAKPLDIYKQERSNYTIKNNGSYTSEDKNDDVTRQITWTGKVGLPYISDYLLATGDFYSGGTLISTRDQCINMTNQTGSSYGGCTSANDWMVRLGGIRSISPVYGYNGSLSYPNYYPKLSYIAYAYTVYSGADAAYNTHAPLKPTVYLKPEVRIKSGTGSSDDPYEFELGETKNTAKNYGLTTEPADTSGYTEETETDDYEDVIVEGRSILGFDYDAETSTFTNSNKGVSDSVALSYIEVDLTGESVGKTATISYTISKTGSNSYASISLMKDEYKSINYNADLDNDDTVTHYLSKSSTNVDNKEFKINFEPGHKYYLQFAYDKRNSDAASESNKDEFSIKVTYDEDTPITSEYTRYDGVIPILNAEPDTVEMLRDISLTQSLEIVNTRDMILDLNGHILTTSANTNVINNSGNLTVIDSKYKEDIADTAQQYSSDMAEYNEEISGLNAQYQQEFDSYTVNSYVSDGLNLNLSGVNHGNEEGKWKDQTSNGHDQTLTNATWSEDGKGLTFGENGSGTGTFPKNQYGTFEITFDITNPEEYYTNTGLKYVLTSRGYSVSYFKDYNERDKIRVTSGSYLSEDIMLDVTKPMTVQVTHGSQGYSLYINGKFYAGGISDAKNTYQDGDAINLASKRGNTYSVRMYNRVLTEEELHKNYLIDSKLYNNKTENKYGSESISDTHSFAQYYTCYNASTTVGCNLTAGPSYYVTSSSIMTEVINSSYPVNFDSNYKYLTADISAYVSDTRFTGKVYIGLVKQQSFSKEVTDYEVYDELSVTQSTTMSTKSVKLKPSEPGKYYIKLIIVKNSSSTVLYVTYDNMKAEDFPPTSLDDRIDNDLVSTGGINGTTTTPILNNEGAYLNIREGVVNLLKQGSNLYAIHNKGELTLGKRAYVNANNTYNVGVLNDTTGDILDGEGTISGKYSSMKNQSAVDNEIKGYRFIGGPIDNSSQTAVTLDSILLTNYGNSVAIKDNTTRKLTIKNSIIKATQEYDYVLKTNQTSGYIEIINSQILPYLNTEQAISQGSETFNYYWTKDTSSSQNKNYKIVNSTIGGKIHMNKNSATLEIKDSTVESLQLVAGTFTIDHTVVNNKFNNFYGNMYIKNCDFSDYEILNGANTYNSTALLDTYKSKFKVISNSARGNIVETDVYSYIENIYLVKYKTSSSAQSNSNTHGNLTLKDVNVENGYINNLSTLNIDGITMKHSRPNNTVVAITNNLYLKMIGEIDIDGYYKGVSNTSTTGTLIVGENDDTVSQTDIKINVSNAGIDGKTNFSWYDGTITALKNCAITTKVNSYPTDYDIEITQHPTEETREIATLVKKTEKDYVAKIGNQKYRTLDDAFTAVPENGETQTEIILLRDVATLLNSTLKTNRKAKINFDNHRIIQYNGQIINNGELKLYDDTETVTTATKTYNDTIITNSGSLEYNDIVIQEANFVNTGEFTMNSGTIVGIKPTTTSSYISTLSGAGGITINNGTIQYLTLTSTGTTKDVTINNGIFKNSSIDSSGNLNVYGGDYTADVYIYFGNTGSHSSVPTFINRGTANITGGSYSNSIDTILKNIGTETTAKAEIEGITASALHAVANQGGKVTLKNNTFNSLISGGIGQTSGKTIIDSGTYSSAATSDTIYLINASGGTVEVNGGTFTTTSAGIKTTGSAVLNINDITLTSRYDGINIGSSGNTNIYHGTITSTNAAGINNTTSGTGVITVGTKGYNNEEMTELVSTSDPEISGSTFGILNSRQATLFNFYDGIFKGANPINSSYNEIETGYSVIANTSNTAKWLDMLPAVKNISRLDQKTYDDLQSAIDEAESDETLQLLREISDLSSTETYVVEAGKNITIDLNNNKLIQANAKLLDNRGTLTIKDSAMQLTISDTYQATSSYNAFLYNVGSTLMISNSGTLTLDHLCITDATEGDVIHNTGTLNIKNSIINDLTSGISITNSSSGEVDIRESQFITNNSTVNTSKGTNISNEGKVTVNKAIFSATNGDALVNNTSRKMELTNVKVVTTNGRNIVNTAGEIEFTTGANNTSSGKLIVNAGTAKLKEVTSTSGSSTKLIENTGILTIEDSSITQSTYFSNGVYTLINSSNKLTIKDTNITGGLNNTENYKKNSNNLIESTDSELTITGGTHKFVGGVYLNLPGKANSTVNITGTNINAWSGVHNVNNETTTINLTDVTMDTTVMNVYSARYMGTPIDENFYTYYMTSNADITIKNGTYTNKGEYYYNDEDINSYYRVASILLGKGGTLTVDGATINKPTRYDKSIISYVSTVNVKNNTTDNEEHVANIGGTLENISGTVLVKGGTIGNINSEIERNGSACTVTIEKGKVGNVTSEGDITLGVKGDLDINNNVIVSTSNPEITGTITTPTFNFYDGIVKGNIPYAADRETGYNIKNTSSGHYLTKDDFIENTSTNAKYNNIKTAINEATSGQTLQLIDNQTVYVNGGSGTIPAASTIDLNLNGHEIEFRFNPLTNNGTLNVSGNGTFKSTSALVNNGIVNLTGGNINVGNGGTLNINGGTLLSGTNTISGTVTLTTGSINAINNSGSLNINGGTAEFTNFTNALTTIRGGTITAFSNSGTIDMKNATIDGTGAKSNTGTFTGENNTIKASITNTGTFTNSGGTIDAAGKTVFTNTGTLTLEQMTDSTAGALVTNNGGTATINNCNVALTSGFTTSSSETSIININNGTYSTTGTFAKTNKGTINIEGVTLTSTPTNAATELMNASGGTINIKDGSYTTSGSTGILLSGGDVVIGTQDTNVSTTTPEINSGGYAIKQTSGNLHIYDGKFVGTSSPVFGKVYEYEPGYKMSISHPDSTYIGTLTPIGPDERVAMLNGINFVDLQQAVNAARDNMEQNIVLYANITLADNITIPANKDIKLYLNGYTVTKGDYNYIINGSFEEVSGTPSNLGASIVETIKDALNISDNVKNIIVYEMEDGTKLSAENTYKLYKKANSEYQLMKMERSEEIGRYVIGNDKEEMTTVRGRLYIERLTSGEYKVVDNKGKEVSFVIDDDLKVTGHVKEYVSTNSNENLISTAVAELIITIQTGITRINYIALIVIISGIIGVLYLINRKKRFE